MFDHSWSKGNSFGCFCSGGSAHEKLNSKGSRMYSPKTFFFVSCISVFQLLHITIFLPISSHFSLILFNSRIISVKSSFSLSSMRRAFSASGSIAGAFFSQSNINASLSAFDHCCDYDHILCCSGCTDSSGYPCLPDMRCCLDCADLRNGSVVLCCGCCPILCVLYSFFHPP